MPDARNPLPRSTSNPSYSMRTFDPVQEVHEQWSPLQDSSLPRLLQEPHLEDDSNVWTPHPRGMVVGLSDYLDPADDGMHKRHPQHMQQQQQQQHHPGLPQQQLRDPNNYYEDFDNVAYSTANHLLKEDNLQAIGRSSIPNIWSDRGML